MICHQLQTREVTLIYLLSFVPSFLIGHAVRGFAEIVGYKSNGMAYAIRAQGLTREYSWRKSMTADELCPKVSFH
jgi:hypothetical protein